MYRILGAMGIALAALFALLIFIFHGLFRRAKLAFFHPAFFPKGAAAIGVIGRAPLWQRVMLWVLSVMTAALSLNVMHLSGIYLLHVAMLAMALHLVYLPLRAFLPARVRRIHFSGVLPLLLAALVMALGLYNLHHVTATHYTLYTDKPIREEGVCAVLISDVHYGVSLSDEEMQSVCDEISALSPDAVLLLGDLVDNDTPRDRIPALFSMLGGIDSKEGVYFVYGNHDRPYTQVKSQFDGGDVTSALHDAGITILQDETALLGRDIALIGREDASRSRMPAQALLQSIDPARYLIVLDHQPTDYQSLGSCDLVLSGHTHGGQIFPLGQFMSLFHINDHVYGYTDIDADTAAIVSSGLAGWRFPVKTNAPAEYCVIHILPQ